jgi:phosphoglycolate phosphatase
MSYKAVIFDLDGTLLNTLEDIGTAANSVLAGKGFPSHPIDLYRDFVGEGAKRMITRALPVECRDEVTIRSCLAEYLVEYGRCWNAASRPYDGMLELLDALVSRGIKLAVLSNKTEAFTRQYVGKLLSRWTFDAVVGEKEGMARKPDPEGALMIAAHLGIDPGEILFVGDSAVDMQTAKAAGMFAVGALWGFRGREELEQNGADILAGHPMDIVGLIK